MDFVFEPPARPSVAVYGSVQRFPVRRIFCVGRNYAAHAREMGSDPDREPPFFFTKPGDAVVDAGATEHAAIPVPPLTADFHHEVELAVAIGKGGKNIEASRATEHIYGHAVALDLTRRDLQASAKKAGRPWDWSKAFDRSAPIAPIHPRGDGPAMGRGQIWLEVDGETRQRADLDEMIWAVPDIISIASRSIELAPGDLILTGTPAGVGPLVAGNRVRAGIDGLGELALHIEVGG